MAFLSPPKGSGFSLMVYERFLLENNVFVKIKRCVKNGRKSKKMVDKKEWECYYSLAVARERNSS